MKQKQIAEEIEKYLNASTQKPQEGYLPLSVIRDGLFHWVKVPFNGIGVWCKLRCLNSTQLNACGAVTLIDAAKENKKSKIDINKLIDIRNIQENIIKDTLVNPTFEDLQKLIFGDDPVLQRCKKELEDIEKTDMSEMTKEQKEEISRRIEADKLKISFVLPEDTFAFLSSWGLGLDISDIKKINEDQLLEAGILATRGNDNPSDHLSGFFTDRDKADIDKASWLIYGDFMHRKEIEKKAFKGRK